MRFIVLGNVTVDEAMAAPDWPAPGQTVVVGPPRRDLGGKGANQALVLKRAGADVRFVAALGRDELGGWACEVLEADGFAAGDLIRLEGETDRSLIFVAPDGENAIASVTGCSAAVTPDQARAALAGARPGDALLLQGNLSFEATEAACVEARRLGLRTAFNPSPLRAGFGALLPLVDLLVVNEGEARALSPGGGGRDALTAALHVAGASTVVMTSGGRGSRSVGAHGRAEAAAVPVAVVDTTGAGDTYMGVLLAGLYGRDLPIGRAMAAASAAAAITVCRRGTWSAFPSAAEVEAVFA